MLERFERVAVFGGVYSNHLALAALLEDARRRSVDAIFCLGDLGAFGPNPDKVFPLLRAGGVSAMAGNYDQSIASDLGDCQCGYTDPRDNHYAHLSYRYTYGRTSSENRAWMRTLPAEIRFMLGRYRVLCCHGSPRRTNEFLWESTTPTHFIDKLAVAHDADVIAGTHTGIKWHRRLASDRHFVNVGVVGRPENDGRTNVWYSILDARPDFTVTFVPLDYDHESLAREMEIEELPREFVETIRTGWWSTCLEVLPAKERKKGRF
ncbi:MAG: metallophosphoesterase family protein [Planctomycetes bacterium]|nr:metallophosphoesterase family protein [Planctomycetota bacterium]MBI3846867.1 metallophosphoesterase family protein [Planctomycetota bacterium]